MCEFHSSGIFIPLREVECLSCYFKQDYIDSSEIKGIILSDMINDALKYQAVDTKIVLIFKKRLKKLIALIKFCLNKNPLRIRNYMTIISCSSLAISCDSMSM